MANLSRDAMAALDRMEVIATCWRSLADLLIPEQDMHIVNRSDLAVLLGFLASEFADANLAYHRPIDQKTNQA